MGPAPALHLSVHHPVASYLALAAAPTGNGAELFAVAAVIYALLPGGPAARPGKKDRRWPGVGAAICGGA